jgi:hypothetical protein
MLFANFIYLPVIKTRHGLQFEVAEKVSQELTGSKMALRSIYVYYKHASKT